MVKLIFDADSTGTVSLQLRVLEILDMYMQKNYIGPYLTLHKINQYDLKTLNIRPDTVELLNENRGKTVFHQSGQ